MSIDTILFGISLAMMAILVLFRYVEIRRRKDIVPKAVRQTCDYCIVMTSRFIDRKRMRAWSFIIGVRDYVGHLVSHAIVHSWEFLVKKSAKYVNMVRGKGMLKKRGSVSFFTKLKDDLDR